MTKRKTFNKTETLTGIITPIEWDNEGEICGVALQGTDEDEYRIENGEKFIELAQKYIEATGRIKRDKKAFKSIFIKRYDVLEDF